MPTPRDRGILTGVHPSDLVDLLTPRIEAFFGLFDEPEPPEPPEVDSDGRAVIDIRGVIGHHVDADLLAPLLRGVNATTIEVHIDSPGGNVWHGVALGNALRQHPAKVDVHVDAVAASAASVIAMAGDTVTMHPGSVLMVHNARGHADNSTADQLRALAEVMDKINVSMAQIYAARAGGDQAGWLEVMAAETWFSGDEAIEAGLADAVVEITEADPEPEASAADLTEVFGYTYAGRDAAPDPDLSALTPEPEEDEGPDWAAFAAALNPTPDFSGFAAAMNPNKEGI